MSWRVVVNVRTSGNRVGDCYSCLTWKFFYTLSASFLRTLQPMPTCTSQGDMNGETVARVWNSFENIWICLNCARCWRTERLFWHVFARFCQLMADGRFDVFCVSARSLHFAWQRDISLLEESACCRICSPWQGGNGSTCCCFGLGSYTWAHMASAPITANGQQSTASTPSKESKEKACSDKNGRIDMLFPYQRENTNCVTSILSIIYNYVHTLSTSFNCII